MPETESQPPWPEGVPHPIDDMSATELLREMTKFYGPQRLVELMGWIFVAGFISEIVTEGDPAKLRREMEARGLGTGSSLYRALRDFRRFGEHIEKNSYPKQDHRPTLQLLDRLSVKLRAT